jgi:hypothetical protein
MNQASCGIARRTAESALSCSMDQDTFASTATETSVFPVDSQIKFIQARLDRRL